MPENSDICVPPLEDLALIRDAVRQAGAIAKAAYIANDSKRWDKSDNSPVTEADIAVNTLIQERLMAARPDYGWLSEETDDDAVRLGCERVFILDPIDGTRSFIAGHEDFAHSFAVAENGIVTAAIVHMPAKGLTFEATLGGGATLNGASITASSADVMEAATTLAAKPMMDQKHWPGGVPPIKRSFRSSLAYRLSLVANGRFDAMFTFRPAWEWDVAAGHLICTEAGADVFDVQGGVPTYNSAGAKTAGMIACAPGLSADLKARAKG